MWLRVGRPPRATGLSAGRLHKPNHEDLDPHLTHSSTLNQGCSMGVYSSAALGLIGKTEAHGCAESLVVFLLGLAAVNRRRHASHRLPTGGYRYTTRASINNIGHIAQDVVLR